MDKKIITVLMGGSGQWLCKINGIIVAHGHVPRAVPRDGHSVEGVILRQLIRQADNIREGEKPMLGGGSEYNIEVPEWLYDKFVNRSEDIIERASHCPFCGKKGEIHYGRHNIRYFECCKKSWEITQDGRTVA